MASKKGIIVTVAVLAGITGASFLAWFLPDGNLGSNDATFVITDHREYLDEVKNIREVLAESAAIDFDRMLNGEITPGQYMQISEATSTQTAMQISEFITSKPPDIWQDSYILYGDALMSFNAYIAETEVTAAMISDMIEGGAAIGDTLAEGAISESRKAAGALLAESEEYAKRSDAARPQGQ